MSDISGLAVVFASAGLSAAIAELVERIAPVGADGPAVLALRHRPARMRAIVWAAVAVFATALGLWTQLTVGWVGTGGPGRAVGTILVSSGLPVVCCDLMSGSVPTIAVLCWAMAFFSCVGEEWRLPSYAFIFGWVVTQIVRRWFRAVRRVEICGSMDPILVGIACAWASLGGSTGAEAGLAMALIGALRLLGGRKILPLGPATVAAAALAYGTGGMT